MIYFHLVWVACQTVSVFSFPPTKVATCSPRLPISSKLIIMSQFELEDYRRWNFTVWLIPMLNRRTELALKILFVRETTVCLFDIIERTWIPVSPTRHRKITTLNTVHWHTIDINGKWNKTLVDEGNSPRALHLHFCWRLPHRHPFLANFWFLMIYSIHVQVIYVRWSQISPFVRYPICHLTGVWKTRIVNSRE